MAALPQEARSLSRRPPRPGHIASLSQGSWLGVSGMGAVHARRMALTLVAQGVRGLVSWGTCGGLAPELAAGTLIVASHVLTLDGSSYPTSALPMTDFVGALASPVRSGALLSVSEPVTSVLEKARLYRQSGALGVDMESAELARTAAECGVDFLALRVVVDPATEPLPAALVGTIDEFGHLRVRMLLAALGVSTKRWGELWRLSRHFGRAQGTLATLATWIEAASAGSSR
ncbi:MAG: phosphorylase family protein [Acidiferrobacter sp.]